MLEVKYTGIFSDSMAWLVQIAISTTDFDGKQTEVRNISQIVDDDVFLNTPLLWEHWGKPVFTGVDGVYLVQVSIPVTNGGWKASLHLGMSIACLDREKQ